MTRANDLIVFHEHRVEVLHLLNVIRPVLNDDYKIAGPHLKRLRRELSNALTRFQVYKHTALYDPTIENDPVQEPIATSLKADCIKLGVDYQIFKTTWSEADIMVKWPQYRLSCLGLMASIRERLAKEDSIVRTMKLD